MPGTLNLHFPINTDKYSFLKSSEFFRLLNVFPDIRCEGTRKLDRLKTGRLACSTTVQHSEGSTETALDEILQN